MKSILSSSSSPWRVFLLLALCARAEDETEERSYCSVYLAESSTSTVAEPKFGIFAGTDLNKGDPIGAPEIAINIPNLLGNARPQDTHNDPRILAAIQSAELLEQYIWVPDPAGGRFELAQGKLVTAIPGVGVLGGFHEQLTNADWYHGAAYARRSVGELPGNPHPGRGASTQFYNVTLAAKHTIAAGSEIFVDYGDNWDTGEQESVQLTKEDYQKLDIMVDQMIEFFKKYDDELTDTSRNEIYDFLVKDIMNAATGADKGKKITELLPDDPEELVAFREEHGGSSLRAAQPASVKSLEWLEANGMCFDNLVAGPSTIPIAGRGAFARRSVAAGDRVVPVPLVPIPQKSVVNMYEVEAGEDPQKGETVWFRASDEKEGTQLLLNYCFGHAESSMLFFPSGSLVGLINHSREKANAKLVWSDHPMHHPDWFELSPNELLEEKYAYLGLMMDVVATRDIEEGEEVFLDYGDDWVRAWDEHTEYWQGLLDDGNCPNPWPFRALDINQQFQDKPFELKQEIPEHLRQMCFLVVSDIKDDPTTKNWAVPKRGSVYDSENLFDCVVTERHPTPETKEGLAFNYTVQWTSDEGEVTTVLNVPHQAIVHVDAAGYGDQFDPDAFRHPIGIPDEIFPQGAWRNIKDEEKEEESEVEEEEE